MLRQAESYLLSLRIPQGVNKTKAKPDAMMSGEVNYKW